tara:strand:- start:243 stop:695 length:453 start_codon:yes stop_codon:yes gene_type:complete
MVNALKLTWHNRQVSSRQFVKSDPKVSTLNSRTMAISGSMILLFLIIHLRYLWYTYQAHLFISPEETYYDVILRNDWGYVGHTPTAIFYIITIFLIGSHLRHGFQSALKTFGILPGDRFGILYSLSFLFWGIIPFLFIVIVLSIQLGIIK